MMSLLVNEENWIWKIRKIYVEQSYACSLDNCFFLTFPPTFRMGGGSPFCLNAIFLSIEDVSHRLEVERLSCSESIKWKHKFVKVLKRWIHQHVVQLTEECAMRRTLSCWWWPLYASTLCWAFYATLLNGSAVQSSNFPQILPSSHHERWTQKRTSSWITIE